MRAEQEQFLGKYRVPAEMLKAMAHPLRLCILMGLLEQGETNVSSIRQSMRAPQSTVSQQLGILRRAGLVADVRRGKRVAYRIADPKVRRIIELLVRLVNEEA
jgi:ArsR family transcriptional regulator